jgi:parallel beta-helix repeat protein
MANRDSNRFSFGMKPKLINGKVRIYVESGSGGSYHKLPQDDPRYITGFISPDMNRRATGAPWNKKNYTSTGVLFSQVSSSTVSNCTFFSSDNGITDRASTGGNTYSNNTFNLGGGNCLLVSGQNNGPEVLTNCHFGGPTK